MTIYSYKCTVCGILGNSITEGPQMCPKCKAQDEKCKASRKTRKAAVNPWLESAHRHADNEQWWYSQEGE